MSDKISKLKKIWNFVCGRSPTTKAAKPTENADGTITTKHGHRIIPFRITSSRSGRSIRNNWGKVSSQPRVWELRELMAPLLSSPPGDKIMSDTTTGEFFLESDLDKNGRAGVTVLGQFDPALEDYLVKHASELTVIKKMFSDASYDNPIVMEDDGTVYAKNNPSVIRGKIKLGSPAHNGPKRKKS